MPRRRNQVAGYIAVAPRGEPSLESQFLSIHRQMQARHRTADRFIVVETDTEIEDPADSKALIVLLAMLQSGELDAIFVGTTQVIRTEFIPIDLLKRIHVPSQGCWVKMGKKKPRVAVRRRRGGRAGDIGC